MKEKDKHRYKQTKKYNTKSKRSKNMIAERKRSKKRKMPTQRKENINSEQNDIKEKRKMTRER